MKNFVLKAICFIAVATIALAGCTSKYPGFKKTKTGLYYKMHVTHKDSVQPKEGDVLTLSLVFKNSKDSVILDTRKNPVPMRLQMKAPDFKGDFFEGLGMLHQGDSASFIISADSFYKKTFRQPRLPKFIDTNSVLHFDLKILAIQPKVEYQKEQEQKIQQQKEQLEQAEARESIDLAKYLEDNKIKAKPTATGLYYLEVKKGKGAQAVSGKKVKVHYTGTLLNGKQFDSSRERNQPFEFQLGANQVIPGWDEGISKMKAGGKAKLIIPSKLAYGPNGTGPIPPYSALVFEVELLSVE